MYSIWHIHSAWIIVIFFPPLFVGSFISSNLFPPSLTFLLYIPFFCPCSFYYFHSLLQSFFGPSLFCLSSPFTFLFLFHSFLFLHFLSEVHWVLQFSSSCFYTVILSLNLFFFCFCLFSLFSFIFFILFHCLISAYIFSFYCFILQLLAYNITFSSFSSVDCLSLIKHHNIPCIQYST